MRVSFDLSDGDNIPTYLLVGAEYYDDRIVTNVLQLETIIKLISVRASRTSILFYYVVWLFTQCFAIGTMESDGKFYLPIYPVPAEL